MGVAHKIPEDLTVFLLCSSSQSIIFRQPVTSPQGPDTQSPNHKNMKITATVFLLVASCAHLAWAYSSSFPEDRDFQVRSKEQIVIAWLLFVIWLFYIIKLTV